MILSKSESRIQRIHRILDELSQIKDSGFLAATEEKQIELLSLLLTEMETLMQAGVKRQVQRLTRLEETAAILEEQLVENVTAANEFGQWLWVFLIRRHGWDPSNLRDEVASMVNSGAGSLEPCMMPRIRGNAET